MPETAAAEAVAPSVSFNPSRPPGWVILALPMVDAAAVVLSLVLSIILLRVYRPWLVSGPPHKVQVAAHIWLWWLLLPSSLGWMARFGFYAFQRPALPVLFTRLLKVQLWTLMVLSIVVFVFKLDVISRLVVFGYIALFVPVDLLGRMGFERYWRRYRSHVYNVARVLIVGSRARARDLVNFLHAAVHHDFAIVGYCDGRDAVVSGMDGVASLGPPGNLPQLLFQHSVDILAFAMPPAMVPGGDAAMAAANDLGLRIIVVPNFYWHELPENLVPRLGQLAGLPVTELGDRRISARYRILKRLLDLSVSACLLLLLSPLMALIALAIKLSDPDAPLLYDWHVMGTNKKPIHSYKFRTMVPDAEARKAELLGQNEMSGPVFKMRNDPRVTRLGRWLRRFSLDELPQLYSVFKGDLSLVGPRPPSRTETDRFEFWQRRKLCMKPGLTCLWQIRGRNEIHDFDDWVRLDLEYISRASFPFDLLILLRTIPAVLLGRGAY